MAGNTSSGRKGKTRKPAAQTGGQFNKRCPRDMSKRARAIWREIVPKLEALGVLTDLDYLNLIRLCELYELHAMAMADLKENGLQYETTSDRGSYVRKPNQADAMRARYANEIKDLSAKFGLTPKDREQIKAHKGKVAASIRDKYQK